LLHEKVKRPFVEPNRDDDDDSIKQSTDNDSDQQQQSQRRRSLLSDNNDNEDTNEDTNDNNNNNSEQETSDSDNELIPLNADLSLAICLERRAAIKPKVLGEQYTTSLLEHVRSNQSLLAHPIAFARLSPLEMHITHYLLRKFF
jgi:hypothetical protein